MRPNNRELSQEDWPDLLVGGAKLFRLIPSKSMKDFQAPAACLYNKTSKDYVLAVGKALVVYEATTGSTRGGYPSPGRSRRRPSTCLGNGESFWGRRTARCWS